MKISYAVPSWICDIFACMGNCLGRCSQPPMIIAVDEPSYGLKIQGRTVKKASISEDFWSNSACEVDNSAFQSQRSMSSISTSNPPQDVSTSSGSSNHPTEFVNHGLLLWNQIRQQWTAKKSSKNHKETPEPKISPTASYDSLLGTNKPFATPIPLPEMVEFLTDTWEQDGLYD